MVGEEVAHLLLGLEVLLLRVAQALGIVDVGVGGKADEAVVHRAVFLAQEVDVVGGDYLGVGLLRQLKNSLGGNQLLLVDLRAETRDLSVVEHYLQVVVIAEDPFVPGDGCARSVHVARKDVLGDLSGEAGRAADKVFVILLHHFVAYARAVVHSLYVPRGHYLHEVFVAGVVLGEKYEVIVPSVVVVLQMVVVVTRDVDFAADDGLDDVVAVGVFVALVVGPTEELLDSVHVAVVGDGHCGHPQLACTLEELPDVRKTVKNRILSVEMEVYEGHI